MTVAIYVLTGEAWSVDEGFIAEIARPISHGLYHIAYSMACSMVYSMAYIIAYSMAYSMTCLTLLHGTAYIAWPI